MSAYEIYNRISAYCVPILIIILLIIYNFVARQLRSRSFIKFRPTFAHWLIDLNVMYASWHVVTEQLKNQR